MWHEFAGHINDDIQTASILFFLNSCATPRLNFRNFVVRSFQCVTSEFRNSHLEEKNPFYPVLRKQEIYLAEKHCTRYRSELHPSLILPIANRTTSSVVIYYKIERCFQSPSSRVSVQVTRIQKSACLAQ